MKHYVVQETLVLRFEASGLAAAVALWQNSDDADWETEKISLFCEDTGEKVQLG